MGIRALDAPQPAFSSPPSWFLHLCVCHFVYSFKTTFFLVVPCPASVILAWRRVGAAFGTFSLSSTPASLLLAWQNGCRKGNIDDKLQKGAYSTLYRNWQGPSTIPSPQHAQIAAHSSQPPVVAGSQHLACLCLAELSRGRYWPVSGFRHFSDIAFLLQFPLRTPTGVCFLVILSFGVSRSRIFPTKLSLSFFLLEVSSFDFCNKFGYPACWNICQDTCVCVLAVKTPAHVDIDLCHYDSSQGTS